LDLRVQPEQLAHRVLRVLKALLVLRVWLEQLAHRVLRVK
jgi:hypothetical protein